MSDWDGFAGGLAEALSRLETRTVLVLVDAERPTGGRYAAFVQYRDFLRAEVSASTSVPAGPPLPAQAEAAIGTMGWATPDPAGVPNWHIDVPWPAPSARYLDLAGRTVAVLHDVFGFDSPDRLRYRAWIDVTGERLSLPELLVSPQPE